jgi:predicted F0F1-ATPase subunit
MKKKPDASFWAALWREALLATTLGWELALPIFGGVLIGYFLDRFLGTGHIFTLGLLFLGVVAGYYSLWRFIRRIDRKSDPGPAGAEGEGEAGDEELTEG